MPDRDHVSAEDILGRIQALGPLIEAQADAHEPASEISAAVIDALENAELFALTAPHVLGGAEAHPLTVLEVLRALSYFDGSTGWYCQAAVTGVAVAGAFLGNRAVAEIFGPGARATCAGQAAPSGKAERVGNGYRISGSFSFGSGLPNASWIVGGYVLHKNGSPELGSNGQPVMLIALAPRAKVEMLGNWNVLGLRGTGSYDFRVPEQIIHQDFAFDAASPQQLRGGTLYGMGFLAIPLLCHASFGLGCTARVLDEWTSHARMKKRMQGGTLAESETFQRNLGVAQARFRAAEAYVRRSFAQLFEGAEQGRITDDMKLDAKLCTSNIILLGAQIAQQAFTASATTGLRNGNRIQRGFRDLQAANAHFLTNEQSFIDAGSYLAGMPGAHPGF